MPAPEPRRSGNPAVRSGASSPRGPQIQPPARAALSARSRALLLTLSRLPPLVIPAAVLVLMLVGLAAPIALALPAFAVIGVFVAWLAYLSWPILDARARLTRALMVAIVVGSGLARVLGWL